jgi:hypothetical protein
MTGRFLPADHSKGDANTIGGYAAVHARPAAFEGPDGFSYSVELVVEPSGAQGERAFAGYLLFLRWRRVGVQGVEGHLESDYLAYGPTLELARERLGALSLTHVRELLQQLVEAGRTHASNRRWWDAMRDESGEDA